MDKKKLAKGVMTALLLSSSVATTTSLEASREATTFLAAAGCGGGEYNTAASRGGYQYQSSPYQYNNYTADDSNNPYAHPGTPQRNANVNAGGGYGYNPDRQQPVDNMGGGYGFSSDRPVGNTSYDATDWQSPQSAANRRTGGGNVNNQQNYPAQNDRNGNYNTNRRNPANLHNNMGGGGAAA